MPVSYEGFWNILADKSISPSSISKLAGISTSTLKRLRQNEEVSLSTLCKLCSFLDCDLGKLVCYIPGEEPVTNKKVSTFNIGSRRFLGNKYKLLSFITRVVDSHCEDVRSIADIFSGTGSVASAFTDRQVITNDLMYSSYLCNYACFGSQKYRKSKLLGIIARYNALYSSEENYMTENFADTYFSREDCSKIGYIREDIESRFSDNEINQRERAILIMSLIYAMDRIANTCGHYDAFIRNSVFDRHLIMSLPDVGNSNNPGNECFNEDANELVKRIYADLVYIDPPYNSRQYCDTYHLLENVARWEKPQVYGVARKMDRSKMKSLYCTRSAESAFKDLIKNISARYILFSYNNMSQKGDDRSNARISDTVIYNVFNEKGRLTVFEEEYRPFTTGKSDIKDNAERLFLCECCHD